MKPEYACHVCCGDGTPISGLPCICGGSGTHRDEVIGLRTQLSRNLALIATYEAGFKSLGVSEDWMKSCREMHGLT